MKMVMIIVDDAKKEELEVFLERSGVIGYTEVPRALGVGTSGRRLGSRAFPRTSTVLFTLVEADAVEALGRSLSEFCKDCTVPVKMVAWDVDRVA